MLSKKFMRIMDMAKIGAWIALGGLCILALIFIPVSIEACSNPSVSTAYNSLVLICIFYLFLYLAIRFFIYLYPWWSKRKKSTKIVTYVLSIILVIAITTVSIIVPLNRKNIYFAKHFQTNWKTDILYHAKLNYSQSWSYGFVGGHDELAYVVYKLKNVQSNELSTFVPNQIRGLEPWHRTELDRIKKDNPNLEQKKYAELYFNSVLKDFHFSVPQRFLPNWDSVNVNWGLRGGVVTNHNQKSTAACLFAIYDINTELLILFEYLVADH